MILSTVMAYWYRAAIPAQHLITEASKEAKELVTLSTKTQAVAQKSRFNPKVIAILTSIVLPALAYKYNDLIPERIKQVISKRILDPIIGPILEPFLLSVFGYYSFPSNSPSPKLEAIPFAQNTPPKTPLPSNSSSTSTSPLLSSTASTTSSSLSCSSESSRTSQITGSISRSSNTTPLPLSTSTTSTSPPSLSRTSPASQAKAHSSHTDNIKISLDNEKEPQRALRDVGQFDVSSFLERTATLNETQQKNAFTSLSADQRELVMEAINKPSELTKAQKLPANGVGGPQVEQMDVRSTTASTSNSTPSSTSCLSSTSLSPVTSVSSTLTTSNTSKASTSPSLLRPMTNQAVSSFIRRLSQQTTDREKEAMWKELRGKHQAQVQEEIAARKKAELASTSRPSSLTQTTPSPSPASVRTVRSMLSGLVDFIGL
jgi:hypothetical protein